MLGRKNTVQPFEFEHVGLTDGYSGIGFVHGPAQVPYHWHHEMEVLFILRGSVRLMLDGRNCDLHRDDVILINSDALHSSTAMSEDAIVCGAYLSTGYFERMGLNGFATRQYQCITSADREGSWSAVAPLKTLMARLLLKTGEESEQLVAREIASCMLGSYIYQRIPWIEETSGEMPMRRGSHDRVLRIMAVLNASNGGEETLGRLAEREGLTLSHLSRLFKAHVGVGFREYMLNCRLDRAVEALRHGDSSISEIMEETGFGNPSVFYNKFRDRFGSTPAKFRQSLQTSRFPGKLTPDDKVEVVRLLAPHLHGLAETTELTIGLPTFDELGMELRGPHRATQY